MCLDTPFRYAIMSLQHGLLRTMLQIIPLRKKFIMIDPETGEDVENNLLDLVIDLKLEGGKKVGTDIPGSMKPMTLEQSCEDDEQYVKKVAEPQRKQIIKLLQDRKKEEKILYKEQQKRKQKPTRRAAASPAKRIRLDTSCMQFHFTFFQLLVFIRLIILLLL